MKKTVLFIVCLLAAAGLFAVDINEALDTAAKQFSGSLKAGTTVAIVGIASDTEAMSEYLLDEMTIRIVQNKKLTVADRANLEAIKKEMNFQLSGEVSDATMKEIGAMVGADVVIHGNLNKIGDIFMLTLQALDVTKATVLDMYRKNVELDDISMRLMKISFGEGGKVVSIGDRYSTKEKGIIGAKNLLFGWGSYSAGHILDGIFLTTLQLAGWVGIFVDYSYFVEINEMNNDYEYQYGISDNFYWEPFFTMVVTLPCWGVSALYGFIRPIFYKPSDLIAYGSYNEGFSFQFVPFEDNLGIKLSYRKTF